MDVRRLGKSRREKRMTGRTKLLIHLRRISGIFDKAIRNGPDGTLEGKYLDEHPDFIHHSLGFFLMGSLAYLTSEDGEYSWNKASAQHSDFDHFAQCHPSPPKQSYFSRGITASSLDALAIIRNAVAHNNCDLSQNRNPNSLSIVIAARIPGVVLTGSIVFLEKEFLEFTRVATYAVRHYYDET
jgi:hypothetical protein